MHLVAYYTLMRYIPKMICWNHLYGKSILILVFTLVLYNTHIMAVTTVYFYFYIQSYKDRKPVYK